MRFETRSFVWKKLIDDINFIHWIQKNISNARIIEFSEPGVHGYYDKLGIYSVSMKKKRLPTLSNEREKEDSLTFVVSLRALAVKPEWLDYCVGNGVKTEVPESYKLQGVNRKMTGGKFFFLSFQREQGNKWENGRT